MSSHAASNADEPPRNEFQSSSSSASLFSSLPQDMVLNIVARVPKRCYPILSCVSKSLRSLVRSPDLFKTRSLLGTDTLYISFKDEDHSPMYDYWYTLRRIEKSPTDNLFTPIEFPYPPESCNFSMIAVGPEIFFFPSTKRTSSFWILDTRSQELRQGPSLLVKRRYSCKGMVGRKIYVIGGCKKDEIPAEVFDLKTQTWEAAPIPDYKDYCIWNYGASESLDRKVYALSSRNGMICYDARDGSCERSKLPNDEPRVSCVIDNVLYLYFSRSGLMWYDSQLRLWKLVSGLNLGRVRAVGVAEYNGMLAFLWEKPSLGSSEESKEIWCRMIVLDRSEVGIRGTTEPSQLLGIVPHGYEVYDCLSLSG